MITTEIGISVTMTTNGLLKFSNQLLANHSNFYFLSNLCNVMSCRIEVFEIFRKKQSYCYSCAFRKKAVALTKVLKWLLLAFCMWKLEPYQLSLNTFEHFAL